MRKAIITGLLLLGLCSIGLADSTVYFTRDTIAAAPSTYMLIDRSILVGTTDHYSHVNTGVKKDTYVKELEITISSNTTQAKVGWIYSINASSAQVCWFDRVVRKYATDVSMKIDRTYPGRGLRLSQRILPNSTSAGAAWGVPAGFSAVISDEQAIETTDTMETFVSSNYTSPAVGDVILEVTADNTYALVDVKIIYEVR